MASKPHEFALGVLAILVLTMSATVAQVPGPNEFPTSHPAQTELPVAVIRIRWQGGPNTNLVNLGEIRSDIWGGLFSPPIPNTVTEFFEEMTSGHHRLKHFDNHDIPLAYAVGLPGNAGDDLNPWVDAILSVRGISAADYFCVILLTNPAPARPAYQALEGLGTPGPSGTAYLTNVFEVNGYMPGRVNNAGVNKTAVCAALQRACKATYQTQATPPVSIPTPVSWLPSSQRGANGLACTAGPAGAPVTISDDFTIRYEEDPYDMEGAAGGYRQPNAATKMRQKWCVESNFQTFEMGVNNTWTVELHPLEQPTTQLQFARIEIPEGRLPIWGTPNDTPRLHYYVEFRQPHGLQSLPASSPAYQGVTIRMGGSHRESDTRLMSLLIDTHPQTPDLNDAPLLPGEVFEDKIAGITIETLMVTAQSATVRITRSAFTTPAVGSAHLLWGGHGLSEGAARVQGVSTTTGQLAGAPRNFAPYPGMTALNYSREGARGRLVWSRPSDGLAKVWTLDDRDNVTHIETWGPSWETMNATGWSVRSFDLLPGGGGTMLWTHTSGDARVWDLDEPGEFIQERHYNAVPGVTVISHERRLNGDDRLLCHVAANNETLLVDLRPSASGPPTISNPTMLGNQGNLVASDYETLPGGMSVISLNRNDGLVRFMLLDSSNNMILNHDLMTTTLPNPLTWWTANSLSAF